MTDSVKQLPVLSRLSLALLEDSGWYKVNYDNAEDLEWGKNLGCIFATKSCLTWMKMHPSDPYPYCTVHGGYRCAAKRLEKLQCNLVPASEIPFENITPEFDYNIKNLYHDRKGQSIVGFGKVESADFCPYYMSTAFVANVTPMCTRPVATKLEEDPFQTHSLTSRCLDMNVSVEVDSEDSKFMWMHSVGCFEWAGWQDINGCASILSPFALRFAAQVSRGASICHLGCCAIQCFSLDQFPHTDI